MDFFTTKKKKKNNDIQKLKALLSSNQLFNSTTNQTWSNPSHGTLDWIMFKNCTSLTDYQEGLPTLPYYIRTEVIARALLTDSLIVSAARIAEPSFQRKLNQ